MKKIRSSSCIPAQRWILFGIPIIFIVGSLLHFAYDWSGELALVGIFAPVNESVWEHLKMAFWPMLFWWLVGYAVLRKSCAMEPSVWLVSCAAAEVVSLLVIPSFFYTYTGALGIESLLLDIFSLFLGIALGQLIALHIFRYAKQNITSLFFAVLILLILSVSFIVFTFYPPHIPLFLDTSTGQYGI